MWLPLRFLQGMLKNKVILGSQVGEKAGLQGFQLFEVLERVRLHFTDVVVAQVPIQTCGE